MNDVNDNFNISKIESFLYGLLYNGLTHNTYVGTLPDTIKDGWQEMCLVDSGSSIVDEDARGRGSVLVILYARPNADGSKNVAKMSQLETTLNEIIRSAPSSDYRIYRNATYADYDTKRNWHCNIVELGIIIS